MSESETLSELLDRMADEIAEYCDGTPQVYYRYSKEFRAVLDAMEVLRQRYGEPSKDVRNKIQERWLSLESWEDSSPLRFMHAGYEVSRALEEGLLDPAEVAGMTTAEQLEAVLSRVDAGS